jgi:hypothetical protein
MCWWYGQIIPHTIMSSENERLHRTHQNYGCDRLIVHPPISPRILQTLLLNCVVIDVYR